MQATLTSSNVRIQNLYECMIELSSTKMKQVMPLYEDRHHTARGTPFITLEDWHFAKAFAQEELDK